jgi:hypothetical protein
MTVVDVLLIGGRAGVGKSTLGWAVSELLREANVAHVHLEGDLLDSYHLGGTADPGLSEMTERNLRSIWANYAALRLHRLIYVNTVSVLEPGLVVRGLGGSVRVTSVLLTAADDVVDARLAGREHGNSLQSHRERSRRQARNLEQQAGDDVTRMVTDGRSVAELVAAVVQLWPATAGTLRR